MGAGDLGGLRRHDAQVVPRPPLAARRLARPCAPAAVPARPSPVECRGCSHRRTPAPGDPLAPARAWFAAQGWTPFPFQEEVWAAYARGASGLVHAPTGMGKTYAAALPPLVLGPAGAPDAPPPLAAALDHAAARAGRRTPASRSRAPPPRWRRTGRSTCAPATPAPRRARARASGCRPRSSPRRRASRCSSPAPTGASASRISRRSSSTSGTSSWGPSAACRPSWRSRGCAACDPRLRVWGLSATLANLDDALACLVGPARGRARTHRQGPRCQGRS